MSAPKVFTYDSARINYFFTDTYGEISGSAGNLEDFGNISDAAIDEEDALGFNPNDYGLIVYTGVVYPFGSIADIQSGGEESNVCTCSPSGYIRHTGCRKGITHSGVAGVWHPLRDWWRSGKTGYPRLGCRRTISNPLWRGGYKQYIYRSRIWNAHCLGRGGNGGIQHISVRIKNYTHRFRGNLTGVS